MLLWETTIGAPSTRVLTLEPSDANPSGYAVAGEPLSAGPGVKGVALDREDGSLYVIEGDEVVVYRGGEAVASVTDEGSVRVVGGDERRLLGLERERHAARCYASSATRRRSPRSRRARQSSCRARPRRHRRRSAPRPTARPRRRCSWQRRAPGETSWTDLGGETAGTLDVQASAALAGTRYRAVFENLAGAIASEAATLTVTVVAPVADPPGGNPPQADPPKADPPLQAPKPKAPLLDGSRKRAAVTAKGLATLATLRCRTGPCRVSAPKRVTFTLAGKRYSAKVLRPATLKAGKHGSVRLRLSWAATEALAGRRASVRLRVTIRSGAQRTSKVLRVTLKRR